MKITVTIQASPDLINALNGILAAIAGLTEKKTGNFAPAEAPVQAPDAVPAQASVQTPAYTAAPAEAPIQPPFNQAPATAPNPAPVQPTSPVQSQTTVPTSSQAYTLDQLAVAATQLMDAGRRQDVVNLLAQFGVQALTALPKEQYGTFATALRALGAKI